jgi:hypothetical protein
MKKLVLLLTAAMFCLVVPCCISCTDQNDDNGENNGQNTDTTDDGLKPGTYKFVASSFKGSWEVGDQIYVHGSYGPKSQIITLTAQDISSDGKTATGTLDTVCEFPTKPDGLYAAWPAEAVYQTIGLQGTETTFSDSNRLLCVAYLSGDTFSFTDPTAVITFTVNGQYDRFAFASNTREGQRPGEFTVSVSTDVNSNFARPTNDGYPFRYGQVKSGEKVSLWFPGGTSFSEGFILFFGNGENNWGGTYSVDGKVTVESGKSLDLGDITGKIANYDGPAPKLPEMLKKTKFTVKFNELSGICLSKDQDFLWGVGDDGDLAKISFEGVLLENKRYIGGDAEAISMDPVTKDLLIGLEDGYQGLAIIKAPDYSGSLEKKWKVAAAKNFGNAGVEGLTYYKDGLVYVGTQQNSELFLCNMETGEVLSDKKLYNKALVSEIADLCYDPLTDWLWIIDSEAKKIFVFTGDMSTYFGAYSVGSISNPESVCVDHKHSCVWVGDDAGSTSYLYRFDFSGLDDANIQ